MINNITQLSNVIWQDVNTINTTKSSNPLIGEVYYDVNKKKTYHLLSFQKSMIEWKKLKDYSTE